MLRLPVTIKSEHVSIREGVKNGKPWKAREQAGFVTFITGEIRMIKIKLFGEEPAHKMGHYDLDLEEMLAVDNYNNLGLRGSCIVPVVKS